VIAGLGILGLAVGFAAQDTFANLISGFLILWDRSLRVPVGVSYATDVDAARAALLALVPAGPPVRSDPPPFVAVTDLGESTVVMELVLFLTDPSQLAPLRWRLQEQVLVEFRRQGLEIAFPQLDLHVRTVPQGLVPMRDR
jgi:potassium efflux system protein